jgi:hypothetical protein
MWTYFKSPRYKLNKEEGYYVPFIHLLRHDTITGAFRYPFHVDPTRKINETKVVLLDTHMHHFSWVRKDIHRKINNSSAKKNILRGTLLKDYQNIDSNPEGYYLKDYERTIILVENIFNIENF